MEQHGNQTTYNVETVLRQNILNSEYYEQTCQRLGTWDEVVDEIYEQVDHVEPWMSGNARGPSTAFCLLYRLFTLKLNVKQIKDLLDHRDSPFIRAVGFLYLRYVADPKNLWSWTQRYVDDPEEFKPSGSYGKSVSMGDYVRDLLLEQNYFETILSRIPKKVTDDVADELKKRGLPSTGKGNGGQGGPDRRGGDDGNRRPASVKASLSVAMGQRAPNRSGAREEGRGKDPGARRDGAAAASGRDPAATRPRSPSREHGRGYSRDRGQDARAEDRGYDRDRRDDRDRYGRADDRPRDDRDRYRDDRDRYRDDRDRYRDERSRRDDRDRHRDERDRRDDRDRAPREDRDRRDDRDRNWGREREPRSRSRSRSRGGGGGDGGDGGRDARDVFRERVSGSAADSVSNKYGDASGKLFDNRGGRTDHMRAQEVYRLGGR